MKIRRAQWGATLLVLLNVHTPGATLYVNLTNTHPVPPYASWSTAATNIQYAVNAANPGDVVLVTNGVYQSSGTLSSDGATNCVVVTNAITLESINGPALTLIDGRQVMRCVYLANGATLAGFTLTNGNNGGNGGGVFCTSTNGLISNCILINNTANAGGGAYSGTLTSCLAKGNSAPNGGGVAESSLINCTLASNTAVVDHGGGAKDSTLNNCIITNNVGGGEESCTLNNCLLVGNQGGGAQFGTLNNCTIVESTGYGAYLCTLNNSIIYYNFITPTGLGNGYFNCYQCQVSNCCTTGPTGINGLINDPPAFVDLAHGNYHLQIGSACINAGNNAFVTSTSDLGGNPRIAGGTVDMGAYESDYTNLTGLHFVSLNSTNPVPPYTNWLTAATNIQDAVTVAAPGETVIVGAGTYANGGVVVYGQETNRVAITKAITLLGLSDLFFGTNMIGATIVGSFGTRGAYVGNHAVLNGFEIVNGNANGGTNLIYDLSGGGVWSEEGGVVSNCLITGNSASSGYGGGVYGGTVYGSAITQNAASQGGGACSNALNNCIVQNNSAPSGAGASGCTLTGCLILSNYSATTGGGAFQSTLTNCNLVGNSAEDGAGAADSELIYCTVSSNSALYGGGAYLCILTNCLFIGNSAGQGGGGAFGGLLTNCTLIGNTAFSGGAAAGGYIPGGGTFPIVLNNCMISSNVATEGGGAYVPPPFNPLYYTNCILNNCTLITNSAAGYGGAAFSAMLNNCMISNNMAAQGAGVEGGLLNNCILIGNVARSGGVADGSQSPRPILNNCTLVANSTVYAGSTFSSTFNNCIVYYNQGYLSINNGNTLNYCCTPGSGNAGCITNAPLFVNLAGGDFHLQSNSPCINAGNNAYVTGATDLDGNPRVVGGTVDIGAYEYQTPTSILSYAWAQQYGLPTDGSVDYADLDGTGFKVYQDWIAGLNPTNALSVLAMLPPARSNNPSGLAVSWESVSNITYFLQSGTNLGVHPAFSTIQSNILGQAGTTTFTDTNAVGKGPFFYRVGVQQ